MLILSILIRLMAQVPPHLMLAMAHSLNFSAPDRISSGERLVTIDEFRHLRNKANRRD